MKRIRNIERPIGNHTSTEYSFVARVIKDKKEWENVMALNKNKPMINLGNVINPDSFQPRILIMFYNEKDPFLNEYYEAALEICGKPEKIFEKEEA